MTLEQRVEDTAERRPGTIIQFQRAWNITFPSQSSWTVVSVKYMGLDGDGNGIHKIYVRSPAGQLSIKTFSLVDGKLGSVQLNTIPVVDPGTVTTGDLALAKEKALEWVTINRDAGAFDATTALNITSKINGFQDVDALNRFMQVTMTEVLLPRGELEPIFDDSFGLFPTDLAETGTGFAGPTYVAPDRRIIEDFVKGTMISLVGTIESGGLNRIVDLYMADHRKNFDSPDRQIDPSQSVLEAIRQSSQYQAIHKLRPEAVDERTWISDRIAAAQRGGLTVRAQEDFAILQATAGGDIADVVEAAGVAQFQASGRAPTLLDTKFKNVAAALFGGVRV